MIGLVVSNFKFNNTGAGGHYYTTFSLFQAVKKIRPAVMLVIGDQRPSAIDFSINGIHFIHVSRRLGKSDFSIVNSAIYSLKVDFLHAFDTYAFLFSRIAGYYFDIRSINTKCGGPKPIMYYYPGIRPDTVFSLEDMEYFSNRTRLFKLPPPVLLPNRVGNRINFKPLPGEQALPDLPSKHTIKIIRIGRISKAYEVSFLQAIALGKELRKRGFDVVLFIVGYIESRTVFDNVKRELDPSDYLLTDECHTRNAARHLKDVDIVVASGRGVMEASIAQKIILCSVKDSNYPYLFDYSTFQHFFRYNFSSRAAKPDISEEENLSNIIHIFSDKKNKADYHEKIKKIHDKYFNISTAMASYFQLYDSKTAHRNKLIDTIDIFIHWTISVLKLAIRKHQME